MKCDKDKVTHWLNNELSEEERIEFKTHLAECRMCQQELKEAREVFNLMKQTRVPEPSADMEARFQGTLDVFKQSGIKQDNLLGSLTRRLRQLWTFQPGLQLAHSIAFLLIGIGVGYLLLNKNSNETDDHQIAALSAKVEDMRQTIMLSLLANPSPSERLKAVSYADEITDVNTEVVNALVATLSEDPNVNVRLAALESLSKYTDNPVVREFLIQSITRQESPLVQSALADVMLKLREKRAANAFRQLLKDRGEGNPVKPKIERTITQLSL